MAGILDLNNDSHNQDDEILFGRISSDLFKKGYSANINALPLKLADQLYSHVSAMADTSFEDAAIGRDQEHLHNALVRSQKQSWISCGDSTASTSWLKWAGELQSYLNEHLFLGLLSFESHYAHYRIGDFYKRHYDAFKGQSGRRLSIVVYLNRDWLSSDGGELVLYQEEGDIIGLKVIPSFATVVVFLSEQHPHEVLPAHRDRYSIAGWYSPNTGALLN
ncbi:MAG: SM-20-related protein [Cryomorphaceae bacterium]|jgi:SM-20-related protein